METYQQAEWCLDEPVVSMDAVVADWQLLKVNNRIISLHSSCVCVCVCVCVSEQARENAQ